MITVENMQPGKSYACTFKVSTMLDVLGRPHPNLTDTPLAGVKEYISEGDILARDTDSQLVKVHDYKSNKSFVVKFKDVENISETD
tara:strand:- start:958 stop:1215 length:258 start_codon:yes stop_codon:yes gene_type:complete